MGWFVTQHSELLFSIYVDIIYFSFIMSFFFFFVLVKEKDHVKVAHWMDSEVKVVTYFNTRCGLGLGEWRTD
jgi:hypothetical protein